MFDALRAKGMNVVNVGDAVKVRNLHAAVREGANFGLTIDGGLLFNSNGAIMTDVPLDVQQQIGG
jgi:hypothetical protein